MLHIFDRSLLVRSEHKRKTIFKLVLPGRVGSERVTADEFPLGVETQELVSHVAHCAFGFCFRLLPAEAAESIELRLVTFGTRITLDQVETLDGNVQLGLVRVKEQHELAGAWSNIQRLQTTETRDAVVYVDHVIVGLEIAKVGEKGRGF